MDVTSGYKQTDVGVIPDDWLVARLGDLFEIASSKRVFQSEWRTHGVPFYRARELAVLGERGTVDDDLFISRQMYDAYRRAYGVPQVGDMLVTGVGTLGKVYVVPDDREFYFKDGNIIWFKIAGAVCPGYLRQLYLAPVIAKQISDASAGTTVGTYTIAGAKKTIIPLPARPEQEAIAEALADADALVESLEQLVAKKRHIRQGAIQELLSPKTGRGQVRLADVASFHKGNGLPKDELDPFGMEPCIHYGELFRKYPESITRINNHTNTRTGVFRSRSNDVLMPTSDVTPNGLATASCVLEDDVILGGDILVIRSPRDQLDGTFLSYMIRLLRDQVMQLVTGTTVFHLYASDMKRFTFSMPGIGEQEAIVRTLDSMAAEIAALEAKLAKARQIKQGMMQELLTGRIRLL